MKKIVTCLMASVLLLAGCSTKKETADVDVKELMTSITENTAYEFPAYMEVDDSTLETLYGISPDDLESYAVIVPMMNVSATEIALFKAKDGKIDTVKTAAEARIQQLESTWSQYLPAQYELVENRVVIESGNYYFLIISDYADEIGNTCKEALGIK